MSPSRRKSPDAFLNRELSWLEFNGRVLAEAARPELPLFERLKFIAIFGSNLEEFYMVRVGGLHMLRKRGSRRRDLAGLTPAQQLRAISSRVHQLVQEQYRLLNDELTPALADAGIRRVRPTEVSVDQHAYLERFFEEEVYPVVTPVALDPEAPFPQLSGVTLHLAFRLAPASGQADARFAMVTLPRVIPRFVSLPAEEGYRFILLEDVLTLFRDRLFPGEEVLESSAFRVTLNADFAVEDDQAEDLLAEMVGMLEARKEGDYVRLEMDRATSRELAGFLKGRLQVEAGHVFANPGPLELKAFFAITSLSGFEHLQNEDWPPRDRVQRDPGETMFDVIARGDVLIHAPYHRFEPVVSLIEEAAADPDVLAIKQILYRTSRSSPIVAALAKAAERGKQVTALVELKARFDEARNIEWARALEHAGVQVIYGIRGLKTHAKCALIVRREAGGIRRYVHLGTGNYNEITAKLYTDLSYLTCGEDYGRDVATFFNTITGYSQPPRYRKLYAAPIDLKARLLELIAAEAARAKEGQTALIRAKVNSLADPEVISTLYKASQAGVDIQLNVRGICGLRPGVRGLSENIRVVSIVGRYLEHGRMMHFHHGGHPVVMFSSADWMSRNLDRRIELMVEVDDSAARREVLHILDVCFQDTANAWDLKPDGAWQPLREGLKPKDRLSAQHTLYREAASDDRTTRRRKTRTFVPHRPA